jgi:hypothetical protein
MSQFAIETAPFLGRLGEFTSKGANEAVYLLAVVYILGRDTDIQTVMPEHIKTIIDVVKMSCDILRHGKVARQR